MIENISSQRQPSRLAQLTTIWLYPRLREVPPATWESMLGKARDTDFEMREWIGVIGGLALVAWLVEAKVSVFTTQAGFIAHLLQFVLALPVMAVLIGPIYLRKTRRGLDRELAKSAYTGNARSLCDGKEA
jgi:cation transport ATPase